MNGTSELAYTIPLRGPAAAWGRVRRARQELLLGLLGQVALAMPEEWLRLLRKAAADEGGAARALLELGGDEELGEALEALGMPFLLRVAGPPPGPRRRERFLLPFPSRPGPGRRAEVPRTARRLWRRIAAGQPPRRIAATEEVSEDAVARALSRAARLLGVPLPRDHGPHQRR